MFQNGSSTPIRGSKQKNNSYFIVLNASQNLLFKIALWFQNVQIFHFSGQTSPSTHTHSRERGKKGAGMKVGLDVGPMDPTGQFAALVPALLSVGERWSAGATAETVHPGSPPTAEAMLQGKTDKPSSKQFCKPQSVCPS